ncbi:MAG: TM2 domain-containing protein [Spirochaetia bacterium]|nr:TM2 domain-containing protein [Spirochaetia bacterium]
MAVYTGTQYCHNCGTQTNPDQEVCLQCGNSLRTPKKSIVGSNLPHNRKDWTVTILLNIFLGYMGIHRFYTGHTTIGVLQLVTCGGCGIWSFIDLILILLDHYTDSDGNDLVK